MNPQELRFRLEDDPSTEILVDFSEYGNPPLSAVLKSKFPSVDFELVGIVLDKQLFHPQNYVCHILDEHEKAPEAVADIRQGIGMSFDGKEPTIIYWDRSKLQDRSGIFSKMIIE